jgi:RING finger family protein
LTATGNICPYCRSAVGPEDGAKECPTCGTAHHGDCWAENGGCAVVGCAAGPAARKAAEITLPPIEEPNAAVAVEVEEESKRSRLALPLVAALAVVAMVAIGVSAAVLIRNASKGDGIEVTETPAATGSRQSGGPASGTVANTVGNPRDPSEFSQAEVVDGAEDVLLRHHELLKKANGDPSSPFARQAFGLLSARKQANEANEVPGESGFEFWITKNEEENLSIGEEVCLPGSVQLDNPEYPGVGYWDPQSGVAMVYVDYGVYAGSTWVLYEHGHWTYDAGYGHVPSRAHWQYEPEALFKKRSESC